MKKINELRNQYKLIISRIAYVSQAILLIFSMAPKVGAALDLGFAKEDGGKAGAFLEMAGSARAMSMAGVATAFSDDASATMTNPAGLSQIQRKDIITSYSTLFENTTFGVFGFAQPTVDYGTFGVGLVSLQSKNFERRDNNQIQGGSFSTSETALLFSHGIELKDQRYSFGSTLKVIREEVGSFSGTAYGLDGGFQMRILPNVNLGLVARNVIAPTLKLRNEHDRYPLGLRVGSKFALRKNVSLAFDLDKTAGRSLKPYLGAEWICNPLLVLRAGLSEKEIATGVGIVMKDWGLDYAFGFQDAASGIGDLGATHRFGFHINFGKKIFEQEASLRWQKKGQAALAQLSEMMDQPNEHRDELDQVMMEAKQVIRRQGFLRAQDLYAAQGYISYFSGEYERSVQSLGESLALDPQNEKLAHHLERARAQMTEERVREVVAFEIRRFKDLYEKADWKGTVKSCEKVLSFQPDNVEASTYLEEARKRIQEPIQRELKIAKLQFDRGEYLDSIKTFQHVKEMDPANQEATDFIGKAIAALESQALASETMGGREVGAETKSTPLVFEVTHDVEQSRSLYSKGLVFYSQGNLKEAALMWERAVQYDSKNVLARNAYNRVQIEMRGSR